MKKLLSYFIVTLFLLVTFAATTAPTVEATYVRGYYRSNGTYVQPYYRSRANAYTYDNYSYTSPSSSNGYGYNNSYYSGSHSSSSNWYTPSYSDTDYSTGYNTYRSKHY